MLCQEYRNKTKSKEYWMKICTCDTLDFEKPKWDLSYRSSFSCPQSFIPPLPVHIFLPKFQPSNTPCSPTTQFLIVPFFSITNTRPDPHQARRKQHAHPPQIQHSPPINKHFRRLLPRKPNLHDLIALLQRPRLLLLPLQLLIRRHQHHKRKRNNPDTQQPGRQIRNAYIIPSATCEGVRGREGGVGQVEVG